VERTGVWRRVDSGGSAGSTDLSSARYSLRFLDYIIFSKCQHFEETFLGWDFMIAENFWHSAFAKFCHFEVSKAVSFS
jgi:hypothetical protein